ncbi:MAG: flagellar basal body P-ring protein FlgI [Planctomycetes bacterium]|nr:flagellar basal body P-ring protein FlgI [Planctomycetota bacterium]
MRCFVLTFLLAIGLVAQDPTPAPGPTPAPLPTTSESTAQEPAPAVTSPGVTVQPLAGDLAPAVRQNTQGETVLSPRIRNVTRLHNSMPHQLIGIGVVVGLAGTGSSDRGTRQAVLNVVRQLGLNLTMADVVGGNTALVSLTCSLPPFAKQGQPLDVKVEVLSDSVSLRGGELLRAELKGVDGQTYVVAQGALIVAGFTAQGANAQVTKNPSATAWLPNGGLVIREENCSFFSESGALELQVLNPSPFNAASIASGVETALAGSAAKVAAVDQGLVRIELPDDERTPANAIRILNLVGNVRVPVENPAKILIDQTSGTVLAGEGVLISPCVVGLSDLTIAIVEEDQVSQPNPLSTGTTERVGRTSVEVQSTNTDLKKVSGGATVSDLLQNLKALGLTPGQLVSVFQALDQGGYLHATLEVR